MDDSPQQRLVTVEIEFLAARSGQRMLIDAYQRLIDVSQPATRASLEQTHRPTSKLPQPAEEIAR